MSLRHGPTHEVFTIAYDYRTREYTPMAFTSKFKPNNEDTYMLIFGPDQEVLIPKFEKLLKENKGHIIFKSEKARNTNYPDGGNRNTLVVFEFD